MMDLFNHTQILKIEAEKGSSKIKIINNGEARNKHKQK